MGIDIKVVSKLREQTGAGIGDCKSALEESNGDTDIAIEILRKKGAIKAAKKSDRTTSEGVIAIAKQDKKVAIVGLACETDFVARTDDFINTVDEFAQKLLTTSEDEFKSWVEDKIKNELIVRIGENIKLTSSEIIEGEVIGTYLHSNKKIAAVVVLSSGEQHLATDLSMQVAAMSPQYLKPEDVPAEVIAKERGEVAKSVGQILALTFAIFFAIIFVVFLLFFIRTTRVVIFSFLTTERMASFKVFWEGF